MKKLLACMLLLPALAFGATELKLSEPRVIDGDTIAFIAKDFPEELSKVAIRVYGVDTPESTWRAGCESEKQLGITAKNIVSDKVSKAKTIKVKIHGWDKYGGRILGDILIDGESLREFLIRNGFAREYYGDAKKSWCE